MTKFAHPHIYPFRESRPETNIKIGKALKAFVAFEMAELSRETFNELHSYVDYMYTETLPMLTEITDTISTP